MKQFLRSTWFLTMLICCCSFATYSQGLEGIIVEEYYVSDANDAIAVFGAPGPVVGSTTYRIYVDMAPGFEIRSYTGYTSNPLTVSTTTGFYNNTTFGSAFGENVNSFGLTQGAVPLDSYFSFGLVTSLAGIPKANDTDGSIYGPTQLQGTVEPLNGVDGYLPATGQQGPVGTIGVLNLGAVTTNGGGSFSTTEAAFLNLNGSRGATADNKVLIGQFTTDGEFSFQLNIGIVNDQVQPQIVEFYTHTSVIDFDGNLSIVCGDLTFPPVPGSTPCGVNDVLGCTNTLACNFDPLATLDDDSCIEPILNCQACNAANDGLVIVDADGDGICDADEVAGCTSATACNFNTDATDDNGSCIEPVANCQACNAANDGLVIVDADGDGICDADEIAGCTSTTACNFNTDATDDNGSCIEPVANCQACNAANDGLVIVDTDGDGICNADEVTGCTSTTACNFDTDATDDNGSCIEPVANCQACNAANDGLVIVDADGDGICDADEIAGCTSATACNFNTDATDDNGSCIEPVANCQACNAANDGLVIVDADGDGVCDADEVAGCASATACNFNIDATDDNGTCIEPIDNCQACNATNDGLVIVDTDGDGFCDSEDACPTQGAVNNGDACTTAGGLVGVITDCVCVSDVVLGCTSATACNFNANANQNDGSCIEPVANCSACNATNDGLVTIDADGDGICDADEVAGCQDETSCNFNPDATDNAPETCVEPVENCFVCNDEGGLDIVDTDGDGICDAQEIAGCTSPTACNFEETATNDDGSCIEPSVNCIACGENGEAVLIDSDGDGICNALEVAGCQDETACNFNADATDSDPASCVEAEEGCTECNSSGGVDLIDADGDGICDADEVAGCTDETACNFNADATDDNGTCVLNGTSCELEEGGTGTLVDCLCVADAVPGCTNTVACNFDLTATVDDGSCILNGDACETADGGAGTIVDCGCVPNVVNVPGCTTESACNFNADANVDDDSCVFADGACEVCNQNGGVDNNDTDGDGVCDADEVVGCSDDSACNFNANATDTDNTLCVFADGACEVCNDNGGVDNNDADGDGVCDADEVPGCTNMMACNFNPDATDNDGSCILNGTACDANGAAGTLVDCECVADFVCEANAGVIEFADGSTSVTLCVDDNEPSMVEVAFATAPTAPQGYGATWVITDADGNILGLPPTGAAVGMVNFDDAGPGDCLIWFLSFEAANSNVGSLGVGSNASELEGCFELSNPITTVRVNCTPPVPGCTNMMACNFNDAATEDDGSCILNGTTCALEDGSTGTLVDCECTPVIVGDCVDYAYYLADILADGTTTIYDLDLGTGALTAIATSDIEVHIAFNEVDKLIYAVSKADGSYRTLDPVTAAWGANTLIGASVQQIIGAAINADGKLLISSQSANTIYEVDLGDQSVGVFDSYSPTLGGDIAFGNDGALYHATREAGGALLLTIPQEVGADILLGSVPALVTGLANTEGGQLIVSSVNASSLAVRNYNGSMDAAIALTLDGAPFTTFNGDLASGCASNTPVIDECNYKLYYTNNPVGSTAFSLMEIALNDDGTTTNNTLMMNIGESHIALSPDGATIYIVGGASNLRVYDVASNSIVNTIPILTDGGQPLTTLTAAVSGADGTVYAAGGSKVWSINPGTGVATQFGPNIPVFGGDLVFAPTGEDDALELWLINRATNRLTNVLTGAFIVLPADEINGAAILENGNLLVANGDGNGLFIEIDLSDASVVGMYETGLALNNGDLAGGCTITSIPEGSAIAALPADEAASTLNSYPNPTSGPSQVVFALANTGRTMLEVYDMNGRNVATLFNQEAQAGQEYRIDFDGVALANGVYIYRLTNMNEIIIDKFMIAK